METALPSPSPRSRGARWLYLVLAWLCILCVVGQLFSIGMVFLAGQGNWLETHRTIGHIVGYFALGLPIVSAIGRISKRTFWAGLALVLLIGLQYFFAGAEGGSMLRALHAVNALLIFWIATSAAQWVQPTLTAST